MDIFHIERTRTHPHTLAVRLFSFISPAQLSAGLQQSLARHFTEITSNTSESSVPLLLIDRQLTVRAAILK